ncbi:MAG TPA: hypothetical protein VFS96_06270 [Nitrolancea sp.]|nr:hypothetical protein [Nitrolancea sp.]
MDLRSYTMEILGFGHYRVFTDGGTLLGDVEWLKGEFWLATACDGRQLGNYRRVLEACGALASDHYRVVSVPPHVVGNGLSTVLAAGNQMG